VPRPSDKTTIGHEGPALGLPDSEALLDESLKIRPGVADGETTLGRFEITRKLGAGGMGVVYEARDTERGGERVAVKTLRAVTPKAAQRFKREFRALADVVHPNLVRLYELFANEHQMFFSMERVDGVDLLTWVSAPGTSSDWSRDGTTTRADADFDRIRAVLTQLVGAVAAIHERGKLHRDLKPSNVLVTGDGRVVVLDFGLVRDVEEDVDASVTMTGAVLGTPAYMSPEQAAGTNIGPASDLYSVGVILYQALTGRLPLSDGRNKLQLLVAKREETVTPPRELVPGTPADLDALCVRLLAFDPQARPTTREVLEALPVMPAAVAASAPNQPEVPLLGRDAALRTLHDAYDAASLGRSVVVFVDGISGIGKSALVAHFLRSQRTRDGVVVLRGRCYERESVPYKALDSAIDELARHLGKLPDTDAAALMPRDVHALSRLFPALREVGAIETAPRRQIHSADDHEVRRRGFGALKEMLGRITDRRPLVVHIDDLQWADDDSASLLLELLRPPDAPHMLLIASFRREDAEDSPVLARLRLGLEGRRRAVDLRQISLQPLPAAQAETLARTLLQQHALDPGLAPAVARESEGIPFFAGEVVRYLAEQRGTTSPRLQDALQDRIRRLPEHARRVLETVAVAARRLPIAMALSAAPVGEGQDALAYLRSASFVRTLGTRRDATVETYHDRIRDAVTASLDATRQTAIHRELATELERADDPDPERLLVHYRGAGDHARAGAQCVLAAERAQASLAFDRAAELYSTALELLAPTGESAGRLHRARAEALAAAGHCADAAHALLLASDLLADERLDLRRRAAEHLLSSGHTDEGRRVMQEVLSALDVKVPRSRAAYLRGLLLRRARVKLRGLKFRPQTEADVDPRQLILLDTCWSAAMGLTITDIFEGAYFQADHLLRALAAGEPRRVAAALALEARSASFFGGRGLERARELLGQVHELAEQTAQPSARAHALVAETLVELMSANWESSYGASKRASALVADHCPAMVQESFDASAQGAAALMYMGRYADLETLASATAKEAGLRSNVYHEVMARMFLISPVMLAHDEVEAAQSELADLTRRALESRLQIGAVQTYNCRASFDLYSLEGPEIWTRRETDAHIVADNPLLRAVFPRMSITEAHGRCALAAAETDGPHRPEMLRRAARQAKILRRLPIRPAPAVALTLQAGRANLQGRPEAAAELLRRAIADLEALDMSMVAAAARMRLGQLLGGDEGFILRNRAEAAMTAEGIRRPERFCRTLLPGFPS
jgi:hypothetical protein